MKALRRRIGFRAGAVGWEVLPPDLFGTTAGGNVVMAFAVEEAGNVVDASVRPHHAGYENRGEPLLIVQIGPFEQVPAVVFEKPALVRVHVLRERREITGGCFRRRGRPA